MTAVLVFSLIIQATAAQGDATCEVEPHAIVGRSSSGVPQVGNLAMIPMKADVPRRKLPGIGQYQLGLDAKVLVYERASDGTRNVVPSATNLSGGGGDVRREYASFTIEIPIAPAERDSAIRDYFTGVMRAAAASTNELERTQASRLTRFIEDPEMFAPMFREHRVGHFQMECRVLDQGRVLGIGHTDVEVVDKGRFFEQKGFRGK